MYEQEISIEILNNQINLDYDCWNCLIWEEDDMKNGKYCEYCKGTGFIPTDIGRGILDFLHRHTGLKK